jgi:hypothetical protein
LLLLISKRERYYIDYFLSADIIENFLMKPYKGRTLSLYFLSSVKTSEREPFLSLLLFGDHGQAWQLAGHLFEKRRIIKGE